MPGAGGEFAIGGQGKSIEEILRLLDDRDRFGGVDAPGADLIAGGKERLAIRGSGCHCQPGIG